jgi:hypothetical protein
MANQGETRNAIVKNVQLYWMNNLSKPSSPFGEEIYDLQVRVPKKRAAELAEFGKVREIDGMAVINVRKKAFKADGTPSKKPTVVDGSKEPIDPRTVGNGSIGNIRLRLNDYQILHPKTGKVTKEGTKVNLEGVQVTKLIVFTPTGGGDFNDFDEEETEVIEPDTGEGDDEQEDTPPPVKKHGAKAKARPAPEPEDEEEEADAEDGEGEEEEEEEVPPQKPAKKPVNAGLAAYQAKKAAERAAAEAAAKKAAKAPAKTVASSTKAPAKTAVKAPAKQSRGNSDY